jgi:zinc transport system ATP-binding protein
MPEEVVRLENVWVHYDGLPVLEDINLSIYENDFLGIIGPNGGGKTTLLKTILGLVKPSRGEVSVLGNIPQKSRRWVGYVPQYNLFDHDFPLSALEVVLMGRYGQVGPFRRYSKEDKKLAINALTEVEVSNLENRQIGSLSGGEQQRIFIARALVAHPRLLLLDEPTASIDTPMQTGIYDILSKLKSRMTIVLISHDISVVSVYVDKIACLSHRLFYHGGKELEAEELQEAYQCPVDMIAHGIPHRVLREHH